MCEKGQADKFSEVILAKTYMTRRKDRRMMSWSSPGGRVVQSANGKASKEVLVDASFLGQQVLSARIGSFPWHSRRLSVAKLCVVASFISAFMHFSMLFREDKFVLIKWGDGCIDDWCTEIFGAEVLRDHQATTSCGDKIETWRHRWKTNEVCFVRSAVMYILCTAASQRKIRCQSAAAVGETICPSNFRNQGPIRRSLVRVRTDKIELKY